MFLVTRIRLVYIPYGSLWPSSICMVHCKKYARRVWVSSHTTARSRVPLPRGDRFLPFLPTVRNFSPSTYYNFQAAIRTQISCKCTFPPVWKHRLLPSWTPIYNDYNLSRRHARALQRVITPARTNQRTSCVWPLPTIVPPCHCVAFHQMRR